MTSNSGGLSAGPGHQVNSTSSNSAHVPPGQSRFGVGSTSLAPRTTSPPPGLAGSPHAKAVPQTRQSHVIPNALATSMAAAATAATTSQGVVGGVTENSALDPTQPAMVGLKSVIQGPTPLGGPPIIKQQQVTVTASQQMQMQLQQVQFQPQSLQHQQLAHLVPPQDQTELDENVIRKPSSDITQVPSRRVGGSQMAAQFELQGVDVECCNICDIFCDVLYISFHDVVLWILFDFFLDLFAFFFASLAPIVDGSENLAVTS